MLPHFAHNSNSGSGRSPVQVPAPPRFRAAGEVISAAWNVPMERLISSGNTAAQRAGLRFEAKVHEALISQFQGRYFIGPALIFHTNEGRRLCIPDGLLITKDRVIIIEVKSQHMPEAWWQLRKLYEPVVRALYPKEQVLLLEICRSLDADMPFPESFMHVESIEEFSSSPDGTLGVMKWKL